MAAIASRKGGEAREREDERHQIELEDVAAFLLLVDHVERVDYSLDAAHGAPQRRQDADDEPD